MFDNLLEGITEDGQVIWFGTDGVIRIEGEEEEQDIVSNNEWIKVDDDFYPAKNTKIVKQLPPGFYSINANQGKYYTSRVHIDTDDLIKLPDAEITAVAREIGRFWNKADKFKAAGVKHKRGVMLHGKPGCGKTSYIHMLAVEVIQHGGLVFSVESANDLKALIVFVRDYLRDIQPDTPIVVVIEDIDNLVAQNETLILNYLSGKDELTHCVNIATTNRIDECNDLLLRPIRFDWVIELKAPSAASRKLFLKEKNVSDEELDKWVKATEGFTMAQLKELFIAVTLLDNDFDAVIAKLKDQQKNIKISTYNPIKGTVGFR